MKVFAYCRVSSESQATDDKDGLRRQREAITNSAASNGMTVDHWYEDAGVSGTRQWFERPAFREMCEVMKPGDVLYVEDLDRLSRKTMAALIIFDHLEHLQVRLFTASSGKIDNDPMATFMREIVSATASYVRYMLVTRLKAAKVALRAKGRRTDGRLPYGSCKDLDQRAMELRGIAMMVQMRDAGAQLSEIASALDAAGIKPRESQKWAATTISEIVRRAKKAQRAQAA